MSRFTTPNPLLKQEGEYFEIGRIEESPEILNRTAISAQRQSNLRFRDFGFEILDSSNFRIPFLCGQSSMLLPCFRRGLGVVNGNSYPGLQHGLDGFGFAVEGIEDRQQFGDL